MNLSEIVGVLHEVEHLPPCIVKCGRNSVGGLPFGPWQVLQLKSA